MWNGFNKVVCTGGVFDEIDPEALQERLRQAPGEQARQELAPVPNKTGPVPTRWSLRTIRVSLPALRDYSLSGVWRVLKRSGCSVRSPRVRHFSPDARYGEKQAHLLACLHEVRAQPDRRTLVFLDEMGYHRWPQAADDWQAEHDPPLDVERAGNNGQWRMVGALNALSGQVTYLDSYIVGRKQLITFYEQLAQVYAEREYVYVVQDNWSIHSHPDVVTALTRWPQLKVVWLPTYAPWLNPIEKLWRNLRQNVLHQHRLVQDWPALRQQVRTFMDQFSDGSTSLLRYVGLLGDGKLARALYDP